MAAAVAAVEVVGDLCRGVTTGLAPSCTLPPVDERARAQWGGRTRGAACGIVRQPLHRACTLVPRTAGSWKTGRQFGGGGEAERGRCYHGGRNDVAADVTAIPLADEVHSGNPGVLIPRSGGGGHAYVPRPLTEQRAAAIHTAARRWWLGGARALATPPQLSWPSRSAPAAPCGALAQPGGGVRRARGGPASALIGGAVATTWTGSASAFSRREKGELGGEPMIPSSPRECAVASATRGDGGAPHRWRRGGPRVCRGRRCGGATASGGYA